MNLAITDALDEGKVTEETLMVIFPNTAVLVLWAYKKTEPKKEGLWVLREKNLQDPFLVKNSQPPGIAGKSVAVFLL